MNPQCDGSHHHDEQQQQQHLLQSSVSNKETANILGSSALTTPTTTSAPSTTTTSITNRSRNHNILYPQGIFRIGLVVYDLHDCVSKTDALSIRAIANPASSCQLVAMTLIESSSSSSSSTSTNESEQASSSGDNQERQVQEARAWLSQNIPTSFYDYCIPWQQGKNMNNTMINSMSLNRNSTGAPNAAAIAAAIAASNATSSSSPASNASTMPLYFGIEGYHKMLEDEDKEEQDKQVVEGDDDNKNKNNKIDAVYILVPTRHQSTFCLQALRHNKHVLLNDPRSTSFDSFLEQVHAARQNSRFIQFSTMFVHHYRVQRFLDCVAYDSFGGSGRDSTRQHDQHHFDKKHDIHDDNHANDDSIESMYALLTINVNDVDKLGGPTTTFPIVKPGDGCLRRLARYCVLIALLLMQQAPAPACKENSKKIKKNKVGNEENDDDDDDSDDCNVVVPISVQCTKATSTTTTSTDEHGNTIITKEPIQASGIVKFAHGRTLTFDVAYSNAPTRQVLKVEGRHRYATMTDFVIPHPDGLSTYRLYDKLKKTTSTTATTVAKIATTTTTSTDTAAAVATTAGTNSRSSTSKNKPPRPWRHADLEIVKGQALDVPSGPPQDVMMWRRFASACRSVQQQQATAASAVGVPGVTTEAASSASGGGSSIIIISRDDDSKIAHGRQAARNFTKVAMHLKRILKALDESYSNNFTEIALE